VNNGMFGLAPVIIGLVLVGMAIYILIRAMGGIARWVSDSSKPVLTRRARVIGKRTHVSGGGGTQPSGTWTAYFVSFELVEDGSRHEFKVRGKEYGLLCEGDEGHLAYQGGRYRGFSRS
jgi:hypothetical protein